MELLKKRIVKDGKVINSEILKVDSFLNHQIDVELLSEMAKEFYRIYKDAGVNKVLTIEASGIAVAAFTAKLFGVPLIFAKKSKSSNISDSVYSAPVHSFTHGNTNNVIVSKEFLNKDDKILIIDDFLAKGSALNGLINLIKDAGATEVYAGCTHAVLSGPAVERLKNSAITKLVMLDTVHLDEDKKLDKFEVLSVADIFAAAIENVYLDKPMSKLYD